MMVPSAVQAQSSLNDCQSHVLETEQKLDIPRGLLLSIALVESGYNGEALPYTLTSGSHTRFARSESDAAQQLRDGRGRLRSNLFVGCMQLSLRHHSAHFKPVEKIVDPKANVWYAGNYLVRLHGERGNWATAVARYNGGSRRQSAAYVCKVWSRLVQLDRDSAQTLRPSGCANSSIRTADVAPRTRRAFHEAQVAENAADDE